MYVLCMVFAVQNESVVRQCSLFSHSHPVRAVTSPSASGNDSFRAKLLHKEHAFLVIQACVCVYVALGLLTH